MRVLNYKDQALKWRPDNGQAQHFAVINAAVLVVVLSMGLFLSSIELPKEERMAHVAVPERVAQFILQNEKPEPKVTQEAMPKPKPKPKPKSKPKLAAKLEPKVKPIPKPRAQLKPKVTEDKAPLSDRADAARERAENSGLLALSNELSDLMDTSDIEVMMGRKIRRISGPESMARIDTAVLDVEHAETASAAVKIKGENFSSTIRTTTLGAQKRVVIAPPVIAEKVAVDSAVPGESAGQKKKSMSATPGNFRTDEDIAYVMDRNKGKLYSVYRQARRKNPGLKGRIVFDITILPSGKVAGAVIRSSELNDSKLESRLLARVKGFDFGEREGDPITITYPVEFLPS
ncbi:MAG TPA: AgmX/PglI C-terminal domain-containing protein [Gammaproteobacteria bacterium]|nr:AgmX/PglI C-terminal domain-containing protein [Gammaproteobacteria bacterium]